MVNRVDFIKEIARKAGALIKSADPTEGVVVKDEKNDLLTATDKASEKLIVDAIRKEFPQDVIMSEETPFDQKDVLSIPRLWVIDPIDGTHNFRYGRNYSAVSIGFVEKGKPILGVVYNPFTEEFFFAEKGRGAFLNQKQIHVSLVDNFITATVAFDYTYQPDLCRQAFELYLKLDPFPVPRVLGSSALAISEVGAGKLDLYYNFAVKPWDNAAALLIATEAGGICRNLEGKPIDFTSSQVLVGNEKLINLFLEQISA